MNKSKKQSVTPESRLLMFSNLVHQYHIGTKWARDHETNTYIEVIDGYEQKRKILSDELYAGRIWRLGLIRKFVTSSETVYAPNVLENLKVLQKEKMNKVEFRKERKNIGTLIGDFNKAIGDTGAYAVLDRANSFRDVMTDVLYGATLHADPDRYDRLYDHANAPATWTTVITWLERTETSLFKIMEYTDQFVAESEDGQRHAWPWWPPILTTPKNTNN